MGLENSSNKNALFFICLVAFPPFLPNTHFSRVGIQMADNSETLAATLHKTEAEKLVIMDNNRNLLLTIGQGYIFSLHLITHHNIAD